eukprot:2410699-Amphidinium_carterae.1
MQEVTNWYCERVTSPAKLTSLHLHPNNKFHSGLTSCCRTMATKARRCPRAQRPLVGAEDNATQPCTLKL